MIEAQLRECRFARGVRFCGLKDGGFLVRRRNGMDRRTTVVVLLVEGWLVSCGKSGDTAEYVWDGGATEHALGGEEVHGLDGSREGSPFEVNRAAVLDSVGDEGDNRNEVEDWACCDTVGFDQHVTEFEAAGTDLTWDEAGVGEPASCSTEGDCAVGHCVDGFCCDTACGGFCMSCAVEGHEGTCFPAFAGTDPGNDCPPCRVCDADGTSCTIVPLGEDPADDCTWMSPETCGNTGTCNGMGFCAFYAEGTLCAERHCIDETTVAPSRYCTGTGVCALGEVLSCDPGICDPATAECVECPCACCTKPCCGNGVVEPGEECDDCDDHDGDGCSSKCESEPPQS